MLKRLRQEYERANPSILSSWLQESNQKMKKRARDTGLTEEQVNQDWFKDQHANAAGLGIAYDEYQGLDEMRVEGLIAGLTRKQVEPIWFSNMHVMAAERKYPYEAYQGLDAREVYHMISYKLSRRQVEGLTPLQVGVLRDYCLPDGNIIKKLSEADALIAIKKFQTSQKVSLAMAFHPRLGAESAIKDRRPPEGILSTIGKFVG